MIVIPPILTINITSSTIAEPDTTVGEAIWVSAASYTIGDRVIRTGTHKVYEALSTHTGRTALPENDGVYWFEVGPTNKWAMFDLLRNTSSIIPSGGFTTSVSLGARSDAIGIIGAEIPDITISVSSVSGGGVVYGPKTYTRVDPTISGYYEYALAPLEFRNNILLFNIPPFMDAVITISSTSAGSISGIVLGLSEYVGYTLKGGKNDALNFSNITKDAYGNTTLVPRRSVPKTSQSVVVKKSDLSKVISLRSLLNATPALWSGLNDHTESYFDALLILGIYKELTLTISSPEFVSCTLELEEI